MVAKNKNVKNEPKKTTTSTNIDNSKNIKAMTALVWIVGILLIIVLLMHIYSFFTRPFMGPMHRRGPVENCRGVDCDRPCPYRDDFGPRGGKPRLRRDGTGPRADEMRGPRRDGTGPRARDMRRAPEPREDIEKAPKKADKKD